MDRVMSDDTDVAKVVTASREIAAGRGRDLRADRRPRATAALGRQ